MLPYSNNGELVFAAVLLLVFFVLIVGLVISSFARYYARRKEFEMQQVNIERMMMQARLEMQEHTFRVISQEIHDNLGQSLSLAKLQLNTVNWEEMQKAKEKVNDSIELIGQTIQSMRDLARTMHSESIRRAGLITVLQTEIKRIEKLGTIELQFDIHGEPVEIDEDKSLVIFRIVQEALQNILKHAQASRIEMNMHYTNGKLVLTVRDNGTGFKGVAKMEGNGLRNMRDRASIIGAGLSVESSMPGGTFVLLEVPVSD